MSNRYDIIERKRKQFVDELYQAHPDVVKITEKFGRIHHHVNYKPFSKNKLIKKEGLVIPDRVNNYGMILKEIK